MLLHPQVSVLVTIYAGQDVSVLGEVARPGVYPYTLHHRLAGSDFSCGGAVAECRAPGERLSSRNDPKTPHPVVLDPSGTDDQADHNPELSPGDTVQVSRAGLVYVIGDVVRPGGFPVDPVQGLTVVQALILAWGPRQNAASSKALLIREQKGGRTLTTLNLQRMLHGQDPDQPIYDRDILFVPDSMAKNLWNRTMEAAIQSAIGVTIYAGWFIRRGFRRCAAFAVGIAAGVCIRDSVGISRWTWASRWGNIGAYCRSCCCCWRRSRLFCRQGGCARQARCSGLVLALYLWFCCSYFWTIEPLATLEKLRGYFQEMMIVWLVWEFAESPRDLRSLLRAFVAGSWVLALLTLANFGSPNAAESGPDSLCGRRAGPQRCGALPRSRLSLGGGALSTANRDGWRGSWRWAICRWDCLPWF